MNLNILLFFFLSALALTSPLSAASISPDSDSSGMFGVIAERAWIDGTDPRSDRRLAVEASYFDFRESLHPVAVETPFAPRMPGVETNPSVALTQEESLRLMTRR